MTYREAAKIVKDATRRWEQSHGLPEGAVKVRAILAPTNIGYDLDRAASNLQTILAGDYGVTSEIVKIDSDARLIIGDDRQATLLADKATAFWKVFSLKPDERRQIEAMTDGEGVNLDGLADGELVRFANLVERASGEVTRILFSRHQGPQAYQATDLLGEYAARMARARRARGQGSISTALEHERKAEAIYARLPDFARW